MRGEGPHPSLPGHQSTLRWLHAPVYDKLWSAATGWSDQQPFAAMPSKNWQPQPRPVQRRRLPWPRPPRGGASLRNGAGSHGHGQGHGQAHGQGYGRRVRRAALSPRGAAAGSAGAGRARCPTPRGATAPLGGPAGSTAQLEGTRRPPAPEGAPKGTPEGAPRGADRDVGCGAGQDEGRENRPDTLQRQ